MSLWKVPLRDVHGIIIGNVAILADPTAPQAAERQYLELMAREEETRAERRFCELLEVAPAAILEMDAHGRIVLVNAGAEKLSGYSQDELLGQSMEIIEPSKLRARHVDNRAHYLSHPVTRPMGRASYRVRSQAVARAYGDLRGIPSYHWS